jgi:hypothetical protein
MQIEAARRFCAGHDCAAHTTRAAFPLRFVHDEWAGVAEGGEQVCAAPRGDNDARRKRRVDPGPEWWWAPASTGWGIVGGERQQGRGSQILRARL